MNAMSQSKKVWVVIAAYNEGVRLEKTLRNVCARYENVVIVDDGSRDTTSQVASRHPVWLLRHAINCGQGAALQTGIDFALAQGADSIVTFDADGQHDVKDIERLLEPLDAGQVDVVLGSRFLGQTVGMPWARFVVLKLGVLFTSCFSRIPVTDTHNGLRALSRTAAQRIRITHNRMAHASEILHQIHLERLSFCEVPVRIEYTADSLAKGQQNWGALRIAGEMLIGRLLP